MRKAASAALGVMAWLAAQFAGLGLAGAGHGWTAPLLFSIPLIILYPLACVLAFGGGAVWRNLGAALLIVAAALDLLLLMNMLSGEREYLLKMWEFDEGPAWVISWCVLWAGWQVLLLSALLRDRSRSAP